VGKLADARTPGLYIQVNRWGRRIWRYRRRLAGSSATIMLRLGLYPTFTLAAARDWADRLNAQIESGIDPRKDLAGVKLTVATAHRRYMEAVREGRGSRAKKLNKPRTIEDKAKIFRCDIEPALGDMHIFAVTENDLAKLVIAKGKSSKVRANRLAAELKVFFGWASSLRGSEINLPINPAIRLADLKFPESPRSRKLSLDEIVWYLRAAALEPSLYRRGMLLLLLTACRMSEVIRGQTDEYNAAEGVWTIPAERVKNSRVHRIPLGPWGQSLMYSDSKWLFPSRRIDGPCCPTGWYKARNRMLARMADFAGRPIAIWTPHDLRRTVRSNTRRLETDYETAEAMLNHVKRGLDKIYDGYDMEAEKRASFLTWENEVIRLARKAGVAEALNVPDAPSLQS